jgi:ABC-type transporter Mla MlaB component
VSELSSSGPSLPDALTASTVTQAARALLQSVDEAATADAFGVDASRVASVDAAGIQLLVALERECAQRRMVLDLQAVSPSLEQALTELGLDRCLKARG